MMRREGKLTATANSGIGSGNLYSAALQMWFGKEEGGNGRVRGGERRGVEGMEKKDGGRLGLWRRGKREGRRRWKEEEEDTVHAILYLLSRV